MMLENNQLNRETQETFLLGDKIKKITMHEIHQFKQNNIVYIAKMFKPQHRQKYERQLNILRLLHHDNIIQLIKSIQSGQQNNNKFDMLIFKKATHGSLNQYIPLNDKFSEDIARVFFKQIIRALKYAANIQPQGIYHPNLSPSNILINQTHNIIICGWSSQHPLLSVKPPNFNKSILVHNLLFASCQILLLMLTGHPVFMNKQSLLDQLFRLVKNKQMSKFWQQYLKRIQQKNKSFCISKNVKELVEKVFIKEWVKFEDIQNCQWWKQNDIQIDQVNQILTKKQQQIIMKRQQKARQQLIKAQTSNKFIYTYNKNLEKSLFDELLNNQKTEQSHRGSSLSSSFTSLIQQTFLNDYYEYYFPFYDVPTLLLCQYQGMIELFDNRPNFIVATMKQIFRKSLEIQLMNILGEQVKLIKQSLEIKKNKVYFELVINQVDNQNIQNQANITNNEDEFNDQIIQIQFTVQIQFIRNSNNQLFANIKIMQSSLNQYFNQLIFIFIEENVKKINLKDLPEIHQYTQALK